MVDCPPSLNILTVNALAAATAVIIPVQCEFFALQGLSELMTTIEHIKTRANKQLKIKGILRTMFDPRNKLTQQVTDELTAHFPGVLFSTVIPRNVRLAEAPSFGKPALKHEPNAKGTLAYLALAGELIDRMEDRGVIAANE